MMFIPEHHTNVAVSEPDVWKVFGSASGEYLEMFLRRRRECREPHNSNSRSTLRQKGEKRGLVGSLRGRFQNARTAGAGKIKHREIKKDRKVLIMCGWEMVYF